MRTTGELKTEKALKQMENIAEYDRIYTYQANNYETEKTFG